MSGQFGLEGKNKCKLSMFALLINLKDCLRNEVVSLKSNTKILSWTQTKTMEKSAAVSHKLYIARRKPN